MMTAKVYKGEEVVESLEQDYETLVNSSHDDLMRAQCVSKFMCRIDWVIIDRIKQGEIFTKIEIAL